MNSSSLPSDTPASSAAVPPPALLNPPAAGGPPTAAVGSTAAPAPRSARAAPRRSAAAPRPDSPPLQSAASTRQREAIGILLLACGLFVVLSTLSLVFGSGELMGPVGQWLALGLYRGVGISSFALGVGFLFVAVQRLRQKPIGLSPLPIIGGLGLFVSLSVLLHVGGDGLRLQGITPGGALGEYAAELGVALLGIVGTVLASACLLLLSLLATTSLTLGGASSRAAAFGRTLSARLWAALQPAWQRLKERIAAWRTRDANPTQSSPADRAAAEDARPPARPAIEGVPQALRDYGDDRDARQSGGPPPGRRPAGASQSAERAKGVATAASAEPARGMLDAADAGPVIVERKAPGTPAHAAPSVAATVPPSHAASIVPPAVPQAASETSATEPMTAPPEFAPEHAQRGETNVELSAATAAKRTTPRSPFGPAEEAFSQPHSLDEDPSQPVAAEPPIVLPEHEPMEAHALAQNSQALSVPVATGRPNKRRHGNYQPLHKGPFTPPPIECLDYEEPAQRDIDRRAMLELAHRLEGTLGDYQVKGRVTAIHPGPVVTMYEFVPAPGTKLSKITALSSDLAMALEALRVRIVAPIPGKAAVGIEVPNRTRETVYLKEIVADGSFIQARSKLTMALGKDISGAPVCVDLARMPHLLIAGTTGSGKSVAVNGMVCSLLCNASPDEVKMIMIDPKMLELSIYEGIPHLLLPVVTDPKKANLALKWAVDEMERRYELISKEGVRDINGYNKKIEKQLEAVEQGQRELFGDSDYDMADRPSKLPFIVVLIDEFADLMMVASKEVETSVARIAQKARAAGIHLILATQRPSVDVITGLIKANFPSRIAFQVASRVDSRTILDAQGAENLLGMGDMLFTDRGQALRRVHGALITDPEVHRIVEHLKLQGQPIYDMDILRPRADEEGEEIEEDMSDELYDQAVRLVAETKQASISMVQRRLRIGYNRAARMIERMEREGIVSAPDGKNGREVLVSSL